MNGTREDTAECQAEGIKGYPTWHFPDGRRRSGVYSAEKLARLSGCG